MMNAQPTIWLRSIKLHTYWNIPREIDTFYQVDTEQDASTIVDGLKWAVREHPPAKATRPSVPVTPPPPRKPGTVQTSARVAADVTPPTTE